MTKDVVSCEWVRFCYTAGWFAYIKNDRRRYVDRIVAYKSLLIFLVIKIKNRHLVWFDSVT